MKPKVREIYGVLAEFETPERLVAAAAAMKDAGYLRIETYSPYPIERLDATQDVRSWLLPLFAAGGALGGAAIAYAMQYYSSVIDYPLNVGGKPYHSWPTFIPITLEFAIVGAAVVALLVLFLLGGLPRLHHPLFNDERFERATRDRFFLCATSDDPRFDSRLTARHLQRLHAVYVAEVPW